LSYHADRQTHTHRERERERERDAAKRFTPTTVVGVSNYRTVIMDTEAVGTEHNKSMDLIIMMVETMFVATVQRIECANSTACNAFSLLTTVYVDSGQTCR